MVWGSALRKLALKSVHFQFLKYYNRPITAMAMKTSGVFNPQIPSVWNMNPQNPAASPKHCPLSIVYVC